MSWMQAIFLLTGVVTLGSAAAAVGARRILHAAMWLVMALLGVAILFALLEANFFAVVQILVYIGAIAILIIFAVMLSRTSLVLEGSQTHKKWGLAAIGLLIVLVALVAALSLWLKWNVTAGTLPPGAGDLAKLGKLLVDPNSYLLPFELSSILLLAALVGSIYVAAEKKEERK